MSRDDSWLADMLSHARLANDAVAGVTYEQFVADVEKKAAVTHFVMIVGEAATQVSDERREILSNVPWSQIIGTRNRIVHHYFKVDPAIIWGIVKNDLPVLIGQLEAELAPPQTPT